MDIADVKGLLVLLFMLFFGAAVVIFAIGYAVSTPAGTYRVECFNNGEKESLVVFKESKTGQWFNDQTGNPIYLPSGCLYERLLKGE